jgi:hypothetical protein
MDLGGGGVRLVKRLQVPLHANFTSEQSLSLTMLTTVIFESYNLTILLSLPLF